MLISNTNIFVEKLEGTGPLNFILIHNAGGNHNFFTYQIQMLRKYGNVIQLDLPGHGDSDVTADLKMRDLSFIIIQICKELSLDNICLIGLNNGADIAIDIQDTNLLDIKGIVLIDPPLFMDKDFINEINYFIEQLRCSDYSSFICSLADDLFIATDGINKQIAINAFNMVDKNSLQQIFRGLIEWNSNSGIIVKDITVPTLCILTDEHHCSYDKLKQEAPQFEIGKVIGSKCWATLEVPDQVNAMIERFLQIALNAVS